MAESWLRAKVKNLDDAKKYVSSNMNTTTIKAKPLPEYYEQYDESIEDKAEKEALLKKLKELDDERNSS